MSAADALPREELLRATAGLQLPMSKWRGTSGRIYVVSIARPVETEADDLVGTVVIAVRRDGTGFSAGIARAVRVTDIADADTARAFLAVLPKAITELHLHRIQPDAAERARIVTDLQPE